MAPIVVIQRLFLFVSEGRAACIVVELSRPPPGCLRCSSYASPHKILRNVFRHVPMPAYVDEHVEARYEEIINHLHKALSSTEQDEQDFKVHRLVCENPDRRVEPCCFESRVANTISSCARGDT